MSVKMITVNRPLLPVKGHYFLFFGGLAGVLPFLMTMAEQFGASPAMIGIMYSTLPFFVMVAKPAFGSIADKFQQKKSVFLACVTMMTAAFFTIYFIPTVEEPGDVSFSLMCRDNSLSLLTCNLPHRNNTWLSYNTTTMCAFTCPMSEADALLFDSCSNSSSMFCSFQGSNGSIVEGTSHPNSTKSPDTISFVAEVDLGDAFIQEACVKHPVLSFSTSDLSDFVPSCVNETYIACDINCTSDAFSLPEVTKKDGQLFSIETFQFTYQIIFLWICMAFAWISMGVATSMGDTVVLNKLTNKGDFGRQRLWGAFGWGSLSILSGKLIDLVSEGKKRLDFTPGYIIVLVCGILDVIIASQIKVQKTEKPKNLLKNVGELFRKPGVLVFAISVFLVGCLTGILWTFLIVYLNDMKAEQFLIGLTLGVQCFLGEVPFFFFSNWFLKKIGHAHSMTLVLAIFGFRFILYSFISNPWMTLPIELTQGITYGIFFTALATYSSLIAPPSAQATMQGILQGVFEGFGVGVGSLIGGVLYQTVGGKLMFLICGVTSISCSIAVGFFNCLHARRELKNTSLDRENNLTDDVITIGTELENLAPRKNLFAEKDENVYDTNQST